MSLSIKEEEVLRSLFKDHSMNISGLQQEMYLQFKMPIAVVRKHVNTLFSEGERKERSIQTRRFHIGKPKVRWDEYFVVWRPTWYTGASCSDGRVEEHIIVYCETHSLTELPKGYVVHHIDLNPLNNEPSNLQLLTRAEHVALHKRLLKGVE